MLLNLDNEQNTRKLGNWLAKVLFPGDLILLSGELGSGKTTFAQGIAEGLRISGYVPSPTFMIVHQYDGAHKLFHIDLYRLSNPAEFTDLAVDEMLEEGIVIIEWPEMASEFLINHDLKVSIEQDSDTSRIFEFDISNERLKRKFEKFDPAILLNNAPTN